ncbi:MAG: YeeE/YedE thiosulfate transporter family protein [Bacteroidota bacterium]
MEFIKQPWHWSVAGILIGLTVPTLLLLGNKPFGISSTLRQICAACVPANISFFKYDWKKETWNLFFVVGIFGGGFLAAQFLADPNAIQLASSTKSDLEALGIKDFTGLLPADIFSFDQLFTFKGFVFIVLGGFLVGFGTRWANGCTSGHSIMGISNLQWPSLVATICFFIGGLFVTYFILPLLF